MRSEIKILAGELASPLATSRSALAMLLAGDLGELNAKQREYLEHVLQLDDYMISLVASWADMERLSRGQVVLEVEPVNIGSVVASQISASRTTQWPMVLADPLRLRQIIMNCLEVMHQPRVRARVVRDMCVLTLHDPLLRDHKKRASFLEALHSDAPTAQLGLRIAKLLAEAHGGTLEINPHATDGTRLHLKLPLAKQMTLLGELED